MTRYRSLLILAVLVFMGIAPVASPAAAQDPTPTPKPDGPPFSLPFAEPAGPNIWLYEQHYGNTVSAFNYGNIWYASGQGLHFGLDLEAPCQTPVLAIADGEVAYVDADSFGAGPHNLVLKHPGTGYTSLYGHLYQVPDLQRGQTVKRGEQIALTGDPDGSCESRPHLHLEIRSPDYQTTYNPLPLFDVNWHMLTSIGPHENTFQQDLDAPYRWMTLEDQPEVKFGGNWLNNYLHPWPPRLEQRPPDNPPAARHLDPLPDSVTVTRTPVALDKWNINAWWKPGDLDAVYVIDAVPDQPTSVFRQPLDGSERRYVEPAPPTLVAPDGSVTARSTGAGSFTITRKSDSAQWEVATGYHYPAISPDGTRLLWEVFYGDVVPGQPAPGMEIWISNLDGSLRRMVHSQAGGWSMWLDSHRLLIVKTIIYSANVQLFVLDVDDPAVTPYLLAEYRYVRRIRVAPGGRQIAFYLPYQDNPDDSGVYVQAITEGSQPRKLPFFGAYEWRDDRSLYTLSYDIAQDVHTLGVVDVQQGTYRTLTDPADLPIRVANGDWSVSPDGTRITYVDPEDYGLYLLTVQPES